MANNRIYIRCKGCGEALFLGKSFLNGYYWTGICLEDSLNNFFTEHNYCMKPKATDVPYDKVLFPIPTGFEECDGAFDIVYESNDGTGIFDKRYDKIVDAVEVVHGEWIKHGIGHENVPWGFDCSVCKEWFVIDSKFIGRYKYCPNCGAKMDGEVKSDG